MSYTRSLLESDVERLLRQMVKKLEDAAECERCGEDDVKISSKDRAAREYARRIAALVGGKIGLR
jgi:hypothetical protein